MTETNGTNAPAAPGTFPSAVPPPIPPAPAPDWFSRLLQPVAESTGWLKFLSVAVIALGVLTALTIVGLVIAWLYIWVGVLLWQASERATRAQLTRDPAQLEEYLRKLRTLIVIAGVALIVNLAAAVLFLSLALALGWMATLLHSLPG
jgi:hypothetical protein